MENTTNSKIYSPYLKSILAPFTGPSDIPDFNMTTSHLKSVSITQNITVPATPTSGSLLFVHLPHNKLHPILVYVFVDSTGRYEFWKFMDYDQALGDDFTYGRFISGALKVESATTSGTVFNVSGIINATAFQDPPDIRTLTFNTITAYKRTPVDVLASSPISDGVIALAFPDGDQNFGIFENGNSYESRAVLLTATQHSQGDGTPGWNNVMGANFIIFDSDNAPGFLPPNVWETFEVKLKLQLSFAAGLTLNHNPTVIIHAYFPSVGNDWVTVSPNIASTSHFLYYNDLTAVMLTWDFSTFIGTLVAPLTRVTVQVVNDVPPLGAPEAEIQFHAYTYYDTGTRGPGAFIACDKVGQTQMIAVSGVANYEVVPDSDLSRNITTTGPGTVTFSPVEMSLVMSYLAAALEHDLKQIYKLDEYKMWLGRNTHLQHANLDNLGRAAGWGDFISGIWNAASPLVRPLMSTVGGPLGTMAGNIIEGAIGAPGKSAMYKYTPPRRSLPTTTGNAAMFRQGRSGLLGTEEYKKLITHLFNMGSIIIGDAKPYEATMGSSIDPEIMRQDLLFMQYETAFTGQLEMSFGVNKFPIHMSDDTIEYGYVFFTPQPISFGPNKEVEYQEVLVRFGEQQSTTGMFFGLQTPINDLIAKDHLICLVASMNGAPKGFITVFSEHPYSEHSFSAAAFCTMQGISLPIPITGAILTVEGEQQMFLPAEVSRKANGGPLAYTFDENEDLDVVSEELDPNIEYTIIRSRMGFLDSGLIPITNVCMLAGLRFLPSLLKNVISKFVLKKMPKMPTPPPLPGVTIPSKVPTAKYQQVKDFLTDHGLDIIEIMYADEPEDVDVDAILEFWKEEKYNELPEVRPIFNATIQAGIKTFEQTLPQAVIEDNYSRVLNSLMSLANMMIQLDRYEPSGRKKKSGYSYDWGEKELEFADGSIMTFQEMRDFLSELGETPVTFQNIHRKAIDSLELKMDVLDQVWGMQNPSAVDRAKSLIEGIANLYIALNAAKERGVAKSARFKSKAAIKKLPPANPPGLKGAKPRLQQPQKSAPITSLRYQPKPAATTTTKGQKLRIEPKTSVERAEVEGIYY